MFEEPDQSKTWIKVKLGQCAAEVWLSPRQFWGVNWTLIKLTMVPESVWKKKWNWPQLGGAFYILWPEPLDLIGYSVTCSLFLLVEIKLFRSLNLHLTGSDGAVCVRACACVYARLCFPTNKQNIWYRTRKSCFQLKDPKLEQKSPKCQ